MTLLPRARRRVLAALLLASLPGLLAAPNVALATDRAPREPLPVAASVPPHAWLVRRIGGAHVDVVLLVPPGASPATHQPSDRQATRALRSQVVFRAGVPFERGPWFGALERRAASGKGPTMIDLRDGIELRTMESGGRDAPGHAHDHGPGHACAICSEDGRDPHTWTDPLLLRRQAKLIADALAAADPDRADHYRRNLADVQRRLDALHVEITRILEPVRGRTMVVFHPAWGYFCDRYGLRQIAIEVAGKDPGDRELTRLQQLARETGVRTVFVQPQIRGRGAAAVAAAIDGTVETLDPLPEDVEDGLRDAARRIRAALEHATPAVVDGR